MEKDWVAKSSEYMNDEEEEPEYGSDASLDSMDSLVKDKGMTSFLKAKIQPRLKNLSFKDEPMIDDTKVYNF